MEESKTVAEIFEDWSSQFAEECNMGQDCSFEDIKPYSGNVRMVHFYCENGESVRYDLKPDEKYNDELEYGEEKKYFIEE